MRNNNRYGVFLLVLVGVLFVIGNVDSQPFTTYNQLYRTFLIFKTMPLNTTDAEAMGWTAFSGECDPNLGIGYSSGYSGPSETSQGFLYFTMAGQIAGFGARVFTDSVPVNMIPKYWVPVNGISNAYDISLMFRDPSFMCSGKTSPYVLGDRISINNMFPLPQTSDDATAQGWVAGQCIGEMGIHYSLDITSPGQMTWNSSTLLPVMPMYGVNDKQIKAILINSASYQYTEPIGEFEGPFTNGLFCLNWCSNSGCTFSGTSIWTTFHWLFTDYKSVSCSGAPCKL